MVRIVLIVVVILLTVGAAGLVAAWLLFYESPKEAIATRFPDGWENAPVVQYKKPEPPPPPLPSAVPQVTDDEFVAALAAIDRRLPPPRPPQPADAVLSDMQIASMKSRLRLTAEQEAYWQPVEESLRLLVWDRRPGSRPRLDPTSLSQFMAAAGPFITTLSNRQRNELQALAHIVGLKLGQPTSQ